MPLYEYVCQKCNHTFEEAQRVDDRHLPLHRPCPSCGEIHTLDIAIHAIPIGDPARLGIKKAPTQFHERMAQIKENTKSSIQKLQTKK